MQNEIYLAIRLAHVAVGKSQRQVEAKVSIHPSILNMTENGKRVPARELAQSVLPELGADAPHAPLTPLVLKEAARIVSGMKLRPVDSSGAAH